MDRGTLSWQLWAFGAAVSAAVATLFAKLGTAVIAPDLATTIRTVVVLLALAVLLAATDQWRLPDDVPTTSWVALVCSGLATAASWVCWFRAVKLGDIARVAPIDKTSVVLVAVLGVAILGERLSAAHWLGVTLVAAGAVLLATDL